MLSPLEAAFTRTSSAELPLRRTNSSENKCLPSISTEHCIKIRATHHDGAFIL